MNRSLEQWFFRPILSPNAAVATFYAYGTIEIQTYRGDRDAHRHRCTPIIILLLRITDKIGFVEFQFPDHRIFFRRGNAEIPLDRGGILIRHQSKDATVTFRLELDIDSTAVQIRSRHTIAADPSGKPLPITQHPIFTPVDTQDCSDTHEW
ncbi:hypothetical protein NF668_05875 [Porphyromonas gingivalis]|nr:hypothetical protein [Porphyromonas gingivalis]WKD53853.1 hypothetical protein NF668_05875 [Porphyromonas gingivalis]